MLKGVERVALLLLIIKEDQASQILTMFQESEIKDISYAMSNLGHVPSSEINDVIDSFISDSNRSVNALGNYDTTEKLLSSTLPRERVSAIMEEIRGPAGRNMWEKLGNVNEQVLANYLKNEHPQTTAVILSKIKPEHSSKVLSLLPESDSYDAIMRMLSMEPIQKNVIDSVEKILKKEFMANIARTSGRDSHELIAEIFNNFNRNTESKFMNFLEENNRESAEKVKKLMFTFEDLIKIDSADLQLVTKEIDTSVLAIALKGASSELKQSFFTSMSLRAAKMLKEEIESSGPIRLKILDENQTIILTKVKAMIADGQIQINDNSKNDIIY